MQQFEIYFRDLNEAAQLRLCETFSTTPDAENWDVFPLATLDREANDEL